MDRLLALLIALGTICLSASQQPESQLVSIGQLVSLTCPGAEVDSWTLNGAPIDETRYDLADDGSSLTIGSFERLYAGVYRCVIKDNDGRRLSRPATITYRDSANDFDSHPQDYTVFNLPGDAVTIGAYFTCSYTKDTYAVVPDIFWEIENANDGIVTPISGNGTWERPVYSYRQTSHLQIHDPLSLGSGSQVRCVFEGGLASNWATLTITDTGAPTLPEFYPAPMEVMMLNKGDSVVSGCIITRQPDSLPQSWAFTNFTEILFRNLNIKLFSDPIALFGTSNILADSNVADFHGKTYLCQLYVEVGHEPIFRSVTFIVYDMPNFVFFSPHGQSNIAVKEGDDLELDLTISQHTPSTVTWYRNGEPLTGDDRLEIENEGSTAFPIDQLWSSNMDASLKLSGLTCGDMGYYQVEISNPADTVLVTVLVTSEDCEELTGAPVGRTENDDDDFPWWIILIILLLILLLVLLLVLLCYCWRRRYVIYEAEKMEEKYHKDYSMIRGDGSSTV